MQSSKRIRSPKKAFLTKWKACVGDHDCAGRGDDEAYYPPIPHPPAPRRAVVADDILPVPRRRGVPVGVHQPAPQQGDLLVVLRPRVHAGLPQRGVYRRSTGKASALSRPKRRKRRLLTYRRRWSDQTPRSCCWWEGSCRCRRRSLACGSWKPAASPAT